MCIEDGDELGGHEFVEAVEEIIDLGEMGECSRGMVGWWGDIYIQLAIYRGHCKHIHIYRKTKRGRRAFAQANRKH